ncbi:hypothetical protein EYF80_006624 [Liparis tanakae]|uniref:Uncharacterized protein n=1 Tax=Liparis tanakae TaxID=230148 RepID=A0A4Z2IZ32_9TELE|nr:hypothetical protein EYF80_006624 [Liparis tanakae]
MYEDASLRADESPSLSGTVNDLLSGIASGGHPPSVLQQLHGLKDFVEQQQVDELERALGELVNTSPMSAEESAAVVSLFQFWITDILPMQGDRKTGPSAMQPGDNLLLRGGGEAIRGRAAGPASHS